MSIENDLREQGIITPNNKVKEDVFIWGYKRIRIYTRPKREYLYLESDMDQNAWFITLENADEWQRQVLQILEKFPDY